MAQGTFVQALRKEAALGSTFMKGRSLMLNGAVLSFEDSGSRFSKNVTIEGTVRGSPSVPCATIYMFLFVMQSFRRDKEQDLGQQIKSLMTPLNISTLAMLVMLATGWKFSGAPLQFLSSMANCVVPTSMLIIGCLLSGSPLIDVLKKPILYLITLLRCLVMPLIAAVILRFTGWNRTVCMCIVMVLGCSVATVISIFGVRYDRSPEMASKSVLQSNLLLPVTMPLMMFIAERIL